MIEAIKIALLAALVVNTAVGLKQIRNAISDSRTVYLCVENWKVGGQSKFCSDLARGKP